MKSVIFMLNVAPYGSEIAYGVLNAAAVSINMDVILGLYADGVYLALADQDSLALGVPNLSDIIYAYPEMRILAHEPSLVERGLMSQGLIERVELADDGIFLKQVLAAEGVIVL